MTVQKPTSLYEFGLFFESMPTDSRFSECYQDLIKLKSDGHSVLIFLGTTFGFGYIHNIPIFSWSYSINFDGISIANDISSLDKIKLNNKSTETIFCNWGSLLDIDIPQIDKITYKSLIGISNV